MPPLSLSQVSALENNWGDADDLRTRYERHCSRDFTGKRVIAKWPVKCTALALIVSTHPFIHPGLQDVPESQAADEAGAERHWHEGLQQTQVHQCQGCSL